MKKPWWLLPGIAGFGLLLWQLLPFGGLMGHDFYHYFARIYLGSVHFWQNGLAVPHYTPSLCGGLPVFADPQSMYYSVPQWLSFAVDPLVAVLLTYALFYGLGYWGFYRLSRDVLHASEELSHLGALAFLLNGFSFEHLLVGHMTHHSYLLFPWWIHTVMRQDGDFWKRVGLLSVLLIYTFYSGGTHIIVVFAAGGLLCLPWCVARKRREGRLPESVRLVGVSALLVLAACLPKLAASAALSPSFLQRPIDSSGLSPSTLLVRFLWVNWQQVPDTIRFGKWHFGPWEYIGFVSRLLMLGLPVMLVASLVKVTKEKFALVLAYFAVTCALAWVGAAKHAAHGLPLLRDYHNPIKIFGAFIPFLILVTIAGCRVVASLPGAMPTTPWVRNALFAIASITMLGEFWVGSSYFVTNKLVYGFKYDPDTYRNLQARGSLPEVTKVTESYGRDVQGIGVGETSLKCFEPMFGYRREVMKATVQTGDPSAIRDGRFNLTHPGCLVYPGHFRCERWDRIPQSEETSFRKFVAGYSGTWGVPPWQNGLLRLGITAGLVSLLFSLGAVGWLTRWREREATA